MRKVMVSDWVKASTGHHYVLQEHGEATFLQFGIDFEDLDKGIGNFTTAIVEWPDGLVESMDLRRIRFINSNGENLKQGD